MKTLQFSRTLALTGLALTPMAWLVSGCGGGGGSNNNNGTPRPTNTPRPTATARPSATTTASPTATGSATPTRTPVPGATRTPTPIPTPVVPRAGQRIIANVDLGGGQNGAFNLVVSPGGSIRGIITAAPIPDDKVGVYLVQPGTYAVNGTFSVTNSTFEFSSVLLLVTSDQIPFRAVGKIGPPNTITVTVGSTTFPTQTF